MVAVALVAAAGPIAGCGGSNPVEPLQTLDEIVLVPVLMENASAARIHILAPHEDFDVSNRLESGEARQVTVGFALVESAERGSIYLAVFRAGTEGNVTASKACKISSLILNNSDADPENLPPGEVRFGGGLLTCGGSIENGDV